MLDGHRRHWSGVKLDGGVIGFRSIYPDVRQNFYVSNDVTQSIVIELHAGLPPVAMLHWAGAGCLVDPPLTLLLNKTWYWHLYKGYDFFLTVYNCLT